MQNPEWLLCADVAPLADEGLFRRAYAALPPDRREKVDRARLAADKRLSLGVGLLLGLALARAGIPADAHLSQDANGKPRLEGYPGFRFNLSHAGHFALCAASPCEVGCDVEPVSRADLRVAQRFFTPEECARIEAQPVENAKNDCFCRIWTLKESFLKATGWGLALPMNAFSILLPDEPGGPIGVRQSLNAREYHFREYGDAIPGCRVAVCTAGSDGPFGAPLEMIDLRAAVRPRA